MAEHCLGPGRPNRPSQAWSARAWRTGRARRPGKISAGPEQRAAPAAPPRGGARDPCRPAGRAERHGFERRRPGEGPASAHRDAGEEPDGPPARNRRGLVGGRRPCQVTCRLGRPRRGCRSPCRAVLRSRVTGDPGFPGGGGAGPRSGVRGRGRRAEPRGLIRRRSRPRAPGRSRRAGRPPRGGSAPSRAWRPTGRRRRRRRGGERPADGGRCVVEDADQPRPGVVHAPRVEADRGSGSAAAEEADRPAAPHGGRGLLPQLGRPVASIATSAPRPRAPGDGRRRRRRALPGSRPRARRRAAGSARAARERGRRPPRRGRRQGWP